VKGGETKQNKKKKGKDTKAGNLPKTNFLAKRQFVSSNIGVSFSPNMQGNSLAGCT
jgi:hypothetical protein